MEKNVVVSKHSAFNQLTSLKKLKFTLQGLRAYNTNDLKTVLYLLRSKAINKKSAHIVLKAIQQCIYNLKNELKQKNLQFIGNAQVNIDLGRATCLNRMIFRAKGSRSPIVKHRANVFVTIMTEVAEQEAKQNNDVSSEVKESV